MENDYLCTIMDIKRLYDIFLRHPQVTTDSRDCPEGSIFFALKGETFDGNKFAKSALEKGCAYAVIDNADYAPEGDHRFIVVDDGLGALQALARHHRRTLGIPIVGITGTNGKTTTKELVAAVLSKRYNTLYTQGNFNNPIGVPKTLLRLTAEHEMAVVEMGASHPGDIKELVEIAEPDYGIITNVGKAHLQGFGSFEGVIRTKCELYDFLRDHGKHTVFIDGGNEHLMPMAYGLEQVRYGVGERAGQVVSGALGPCAPYLTFDWWQQDGRRHHVDTHLIGSYNIYNMLAAATIGRYFGVTAEQIDKALADYVPSNNRSQLSETPHNHLVIDAYNANPTSMAAAIANFSVMAVERKMAILGDMGELGPTSLEEHQKVVDMLKGTDIDNVWLVGEQFGKTDCSFRKFADVEVVKTAIADEQPQGHYILLKGSNYMHLYELPPLL